MFCYFLGMKEGDSKIVNAGLLKQKTEIKSLNKSSKTENCNTVGNNKEKVI